MSFFIFIQWSADDDLSSWTAWGMKLLHVWWYDSRYICFFARWQQGDCYCVIIIIIIINNNNNSNNNNDNNNNNMVKQKSR